MWVVPGLSGRDARVRMPRARRAGTGPGDHHGRRPGPRPRAARGAGCVCRGRRSAVWLLHAGVGGRHARPPAANPQPERGSDPGGPRRQHLPLHGLREDHRRGEPRRRPVALMKPRLAEETTSGGRVGDRVRQPAAVQKVRGDFPYSSDLQVNGMLWGATVRSPYPYARIESIDTKAAKAAPGVIAVLTFEDVAGENAYGLAIADQPVLASDVVRYWGEAVAIVAAEHPEQARRAADKVKVEYAVLKPVTDPEQALLPKAPKLHPGGNVTRHIKIRHGDQNASAEVVVTGDYEIGMQDQAPLGPESGLAIPDGEGGVDLYIATQWLHIDQKQLAHVLGLEPHEVRLTMAGIGGAFGAREDLSMQVHACMLALKTGRPVKISYSRPESFVGHVHRHPGKLHYEHGATKDGKLVYVKARIVLDGGAYASSSTAVIANASCFAVGPYQCPNATIDGIVAYTNNPPCGAIPRSGSVQNAYAHEAQMDKLAAAIGMDPVEVRIKNALRTGDTLITGQVIDGPVPVAELLERVRGMQLPAGAAGFPGGHSNTTRGRGVRRGVGYADGIRSISFREGIT